MRQSLIEVTPAQAQRWLDESNTHNRPLSAQVVLNLANAIKRGEWQVTHQGIAFDTAGRLIDGQHRLAAIVKSGISVTMWVFYDMPPSTFSVVDTGRKRNTAQVLALEGERDYTQLAAALRGLHLYRRGMPQWSGGQSQLTNDQIIDLLNQHPGMRDAVTVAKRFNKAFSLTVPAGAIGWYVTTEARPDVDQRAWEQGLISGAELREGDPRLSLRNTILRGAAGRAKRSRRASEEHLVYYLKAWNAWVEGRTQRAFQYSADAPMPTVTKSRFRATQQLPTPVGADNATDSAPATL